MKLLWPLPPTEHRITTRYGETLLDASGKPYSHVGIDIGCNVGTPVYAAHAGTVRYEWTQAGGNCLRLNGMECYTRYCHLLSYTADDSEQVKAGDEIARSGNTGSATTGPHLHFEVRTLTGTAYDPLTVMEVPMIVS